MLPAGCVFADKGPAVFAPTDQLASLLSLVNSASFRLLVSLQMAFGSYEVGVIQRTPIPILSGVNAQALGNLALSCVNLKRSLDTITENSHAFAVPALLAGQSHNLAERAQAWQAQVSATEAHLAQYQREIDNIAFDLYDISEADRRSIEASRHGDDGAEPSVDADEAGDDDGDNVGTVDRRALASDLVSYLLGCAFGRWDVRIALRPSLAPKLARPFDSLPVCSPGMLVGPEGLPATRDALVSEEWLRARPDAIKLPPDGSIETPTISDAEYPLTLAWDGILVDDVEHPADIVHRLREVLMLLWQEGQGGQAEAIEQEICVLLGVRELRDYLRRPGGFFEEHLKRYSKSRRQAPIYWPLSTSSGSYTLWLYYPRLTSDTLYSAVNRYVEPKVARVERDVKDLVAQLADATGREASMLRQQCEQGTARVQELTEFRDELLHVASLPYRPDLDDGVIINAAPLHRLFRLPRWARDARACWTKLEHGDYDWAHLAYTLWPERVQRQCRSDRSLEAYL